MDDIKAGTEVLIKRARQGRFRFYGWEYTKAVVSRATKARIFVKYAHQKAEDATEREFNRAALTERGPGIGYNRSTLVIDPAKIHEAELEQAAEKARRALEGDGAVAVEMFTAKFSPDPKGHGHRPLQSRTDAEISAMIEAVESLLKSMETPQ